MTERIVVGVTDAAASRRAVDWAAQRAAQTGAVLVLIAVTKDPEDSEAVSAGDILLEAETARLSVAIADAGLDVEAHAERGNAVDLLVEASRDAALLVLGDPHPGHHWGDHGRRIAAAAHCAVAVVPDIDLEGRSGVVVGIDSSEVTAAAVVFAAAEAVHRGERLVAVAAWSPVLVGDGVMSGVPGADYVEPLDLQEPTEELVEHALAAVRAAHSDLSIATQVQPGDAAQLLQEVASDASLLVVGTHGRGALARLFIGSVSDAVLTDAVTPTIAVR
ncbi:universal stress protein [Microbacterium sp. LWH3-1.2]|uniref:universal stress protein n=1 Tax=Microbacterium sp. LWH3-1.2 TaxID=3135256 RepID=UPI00342AC596